MFWLGLIIGALLFLGWQYTTGQFNTSDKDDEDDFYDDCAC